MQSESLGAHLGMARWDALYSSDLTRALQTASAVSHHTGLPIRVSPGLKERGQGRLEGVLGVDVLSLSQDLDSPSLSREPREEFEGRCLAAVKQVISSLSERRIIIVTHGGVIRACRETLGVTLDNWKETPESASISVLSLTDEDPAWTFYNKTTHLGGWKSEVASPTIQKLMTNGGEPA